MLSEKNNRQYSALHTGFMDLLHGRDMEQMVLDPRRLENTLDLIFTKTLRVEGRQP